MRRRRNSATELVRASDTAASAARRLARVGDEETAETDAVAYRERLVAELQALRPPPVPVAAPSPPETVEPPTPLAPLPPPPPLQEPPSAAEAVVEAVPSAVGPDAAGVAEAVPAVPAPPPAPPAALDWRAVQAQVQAQADADVQSALRRLFPKPDA